MTRPARLIATRWRQSRCSWSCWPGRRRGGTADGGPGGAVGRVPPRPRTARRCWPRSRRSPRRAWTAAPPAPPARRKAQAWIEARLTALGVRPATAGGLRHAVPVHEQGRCHRVGHQPGGALRGAPAPDAPAIVVSAHYDHLGVRNGQTYHGADDNASGVALLLHVAARCAATPVRAPAAAGVLRRRGDGSAGRPGLRAHAAGAGRPPGPRRQLRHGEPQRRARDLRGRPGPLAAPQAGARGRRGARRPSPCASATTPAAARTTGRRSRITASSTPPAFRSSTSASRTTPTTTSPPTPPTRSRPTSSAAWPRWCCARSTRSIARPAFK